MEDIGEGVVPEDSGLGGVLGMRVFHHKTQHWYFKVFFPVLLVVQIVLLAVGAYLLMR